MFQEKKMIPVQRSITVDGTSSTDDLRVFTTDAYIGFYDEDHNNWRVMLNGANYFSSFEIESCDTLDELDEAMYESTGEHIKSVGYQVNYRIELFQIYQIYGRILQ